MHSLTRPGILRAVWMYPLLAVLGTASLFLLHHLGNLLPFELAQERFRHEIATTNRIVTHPSHRRIVSEYEYCELSLMVLAGALREGEKPSFTRAVILRGISQAIEPRGWHCTELQALLEGVPLPELMKKPRYLWGSKALYAIGLSGLSVTGFHRLIEIASRAGWAVLACALLLLGWRTFAVVAPVPVFGSFFSGIGFFSDVANGIPYAWALFASALFAWLLSRSRGHTPGIAAPVFCFVFVAGMISSWFWLFDGHEIMLIVLFALIGWFGSPHLEPRARLHRVTGFIALYLAGFVACYTLSLMTRSFVFELFVLHEARDWIAHFPRTGFVAENLFSKVFSMLNRTAHELWLGLTLTAPSRIPIVGNYYFFEIMAAENGMPKTGTRIIALLSMFAWLAAARLALSRGEAAARRRPDFLWLLGLMVAVTLHFILPDDIVYREARWTFLLMGLCWSSLLAALLGTRARPAPHDSEGGGGALAH